MMKFTKARTRMVRRGAGRIRHRIDARENEYVSSINGKPLVIQRAELLFRLSKWIPALIKHIEQNEDDTRPHATQRVLCKLAAGVKIWSISRSKEKLGGWGIEMPNDPTHSVYVWLTR